MKRASGCDHAIHELFKDALDELLRAVEGVGSHARPDQACGQIAAEEAVPLDEHDLSAALPDGVETIPQAVADGTGGALLAAAEVVRDSDTVLVLSGDTPLLSAEEINGLLTAHAEAGGRLVEVAAGIGVQLDGVAVRVGESQTFPGLRSILGRAAGK